MLQVFNAQGVETYNSNQRVIRILGVLTFTGNADGVFYFPVGTGKTAFGFAVSAGIIDYVAVGSDDGNISYTLSGFHPNSQVNILYGER